MQISNGKIYLGEAKTINFSSLTNSEFTCDGMTVVIKNLTILRLYDILEKEVKAFGYNSVEEYHNEYLKGNKKSGLIHSSYFPTK